MKGEAFNQVRRGQVQAEHSTGHKRAQSLVNLLMQIEEGSKLSLQFTCVVRVCEQSTKPLANSGERRLLNNASSLVCSLRQVYSRVKHQPNERLTCTAVCSFSQEPNKHITVMKHCRLHWLDSFYLQTRRNTPFLQLPLFMFNSFQFRSTVLPYRTAPLRFHCLPSGSPPLPLPSAIQRTSPAPTLE